MSGWDFKSGETKAFVEKYMVPYLSVLRNCGYETDGMCSFKKADMNNRGNYKPLENYWYKIILADGTSMYFVAREDHKDYTQPDGSILTVPRLYVHTIIDLNGQKKPNVMGRDIFEFAYWIKMITLG